MEEITVEDSTDSDKNPVMVVPGTPVKPKQSLKFYVRRKPIELLNKPQDIDGFAITQQEINDKEELEQKCFSPRDCDIEIVKGSDKSEIIQGANNSQSSVADGDSQSGDGKEETNSKETLEEKRDESGIPQDNSQFVKEKGKKKKNSKVKTKKQRFHRPRIMEAGKKPRNPATTRLRTISKKRKKEKDSEEEVIAEPETPEKQSEKQSFPKRRKNERTKRNVVRTLTFDQETVLTCLEFSRNSGPNFPNGRKRMATRRRSVWKKKSRRSSRKRNVDRWARIALFEWLKETVPLVANHHKDNSLSSQTDVSLQLQIEDTNMTSTSYVARKSNSLHSKRTKKTKDIVEPLIQQISHEKYNDISSPADVPLRIEDTLMSTANCVVPKRRSKKTKDIDKPLINEVSLQKESLADGSFPMEDTFSYVDPKPHNKRTKEDIVDNLIQQMIYQKDHDLSSLADVPLHIEDTLMRSLSYVIPERPIKKAKDITKLIKEMSRLKINKGVTTVIKSGKKKKDMQLVTAKVDLDPETIKEWELLMVNDLPGRSYADEETESKWKGERAIFQSRIDLFINRMHLLQGNRKFKQWKGSVVDSVVGVFLTQNVSDYLSSNAFMSVAAKFPVDGTESLEGLANYMEEPLEVNDLVVDNQGPTSIGNNDAKSSESISLSEGLIPSIPEVEELEKTAKRKNEKTGIIEDEKVDWESFRRMYKKEGSRDVMHMDSVDWNAVRLSGQHVFATTIQKRGQFRILSGRILKFLNNETKQNGTVDLEWLRDAPSDLVKRYLLEIEGIGLKSAECVRLLGLKHSAFPVDTNVGRIAVRLGWVPLEPLPNGVQMHQLYHYPSMDLIQKYLWPRLCTLPQETLYELHYQMITFGKVFCTKIIPNCNACPMKSECKYFASAYVSTKVLLEGSEEKIHETDTSMSAYSYDDDAIISSQISSIEECASPECNDQTNCCEAMVEFPTSPSAEIPELIDIEDIPCRSPCRSYAGIPEIDIDMDALKKNVVDALLKGGKMLNGCDEEVSKALVVLTPENACIPIKTPRKIKYYDRLRTEHVVYVLPDNHELLHDFERREPDDPSPYLLAIWQPGETSYSFTPPMKKCNSDGSNLCNIKTCSYCWTIREQSSNVFRGTILIPCRTAMRGGFPLNGTYFQTNEVFADHETSIKPIIFPREWCEGLEKRALYCGSSVSAIFRFLDTRRIQLCFWTGFLCMRAFDRKSRNPEELVRRLHTPPDERGKKHMKDE